ncbi:hypothetical protein Y032_0001g44 [Ancylostoma ceylanicum]|uniref:Uncharacterized protein n=1 Tax=Ancylostoma ceylanicum TaxID=53326 RepID=A0A016W5C9_9BILA|nr:hypothetical protein Y032_0001g44 [Ancylostoma ceylanicum]
MIFISEYTLYIPKWPTTAPRAMGRDLLLTAFQQLTSSSPTKCGCRKLYWVRFAYVYDARPLECRQQGTTPHGIYAVRLSATSEYTYYIRPDCVETLRLKSPTRRHLNQSCASRLDTAPSPNTTIMRRLDAAADPTDPTSCTKSSRKYCFKSFIILEVVVQEFADNDQVLSGYIYFLFQLTFQRNRRLRRPESGPQSSFLYSRQRNASSHVSYVETSDRIRNNNLRSG